MDQRVHNTFTKVFIHTAKCDVCDHHNKAIIYRCTICSRHICTPCFNDKGGDGGHEMNAGDKGIRISLRAPEPKAKIEKESHTILQRARQARKRRRTVVEDTEEENDDGDDGFENGEIKESQDVKRKTVKHTKLPAKRRAFRTTRAAVKATSEVRAAADALLLDAMGIGFPSAGSVTASTSEDERGISALLEAASELECSVNGPRVPFASIPDSETEDGADAQPHSPLFFEDDVDMMPEVCPLEDSMSERVSDERSESTISKLGLEVLDPDYSIVHRARRAADVRIRKSYQRSRQAKVRTTRQVQI